MVVEIILDDSFNVRFNGFDTGFQTDHVCVDESEQNIREIIKETNDSDVEGEPLILEIKGFLQWFTLWS